MAPTQTPVNSLLTELDLHQILSGQPVPSLRGIYGCFFMIPRKSHPVGVGVCVLMVTWVQTQMLSHSVSNTG